MAESDNHHHRGHSLNEKFRKTSNNSSNSGSSNVETDFVSALYGLSHSSSSHNDHGSMSGLVNNSRPLLISSMESGITSNHSPGNQFFTHFD